MLRAALAGRPDEEVHATVTEIWSLLGQVLSPHLPNESELEAIIALEQEQQDAYEPSLAAQEMEAIMPLDDFQPAAAHSED